jgi:hypothetical protein
LILFCDSTSTTNNASPLNGFPPGQGLKSGGNSLVASTIQFLTADNEDPKGLDSWRFASWCFAKTFRA